MKLNDLTAALVNVIPVPFGEMNELLRALREQAQRFDGTVEWNDIARNATDNPAAAFRAKPGPGGGIDATPFHAGFLLTALLVDAPRRETAISTWDAWHLAVEGSDVSGGFVGDWEPDPKFCRVTGAHRYGEAIKAVLGDQNLADRVESIRIDGSRDWAEIVWKSAGATRFVSESKTHSHLHRVATLDGAIVKYAARQLAV